MFAPESHPFGAPQVFVAAVGELMTEMCGEVADGMIAPAYRKVLELHGWGDLQSELRRLSLEGQWDAMGTLIGDEILEAFAVVAPIDKLAEALKQRCGDTIDRLRVALPAATSEATVRAFLDETRAA